MSRKGPRKKITYTYVISETPMSPEALERIEDLLAKIIADYHMKEMRAKHDPSPSDELPPPA